jgi:hypothetical protein
MLTVRVIGLAVLIVGALAGAPSFAGAESPSAWILWEKYFSMKRNAGTTTWEPQDGFDRLADCRTSAQQLLQTALAYMKDNGGKLLGPVQLEGRAAVFAVAKSGVQERVDVRYLCFPGTFDPRPRS